MLKKHNKAVPKDPSKKRDRRKAIPAPTIVPAPARGTGGMAAGAGGSSVVSVSDSDDGSLVSFQEQLRFERQRTKALLQRVKLLEEAAKDNAAAAKANLDVAVKCAKKLLGVSCLWLDGVSCVLLALCV
jgi:flagellar motor protein MotB